MNSPFVFFFLSSICMNVSSASSTRFAIHISLPSLNSPLLLPIFFSSSNDFQFDCVYFGALHRSFVDSFIKCYATEPEKERGKERAREWNAHNDMLLASLAFSAHFRPYCRFVILWLRFHTEIIRSHSLWNVPFSFIHFAVTTTTITDRQTHSHTTRKMTNTKWILVSFILVEFCGL